MNDKERLVALLRDFGIRRIVIHEDETGSSVVLEEDADDPMIGGYPYFFTVFRFGRHGNFETVGAYE